MRKSNAPTQLSKRGRFTTTTKKTNSKRKAARVPGHSIITIPYNAKYGLSPFPIKQRCILRYSDQFGQVALQAGTGATYQWSVNGLYDPNITQAGHQPLYFDQLMNIYDHYTVEYSKITIKILSLQDAAYQATLLIEDDTTFTVALSHPWERPGAKNITWHNLVNIAPTLTMDWSAKQAFGPSVLDDKDMQGTASANPTEQQYYTLFVSDVSGASTGTVYFQTLIEYTCVFDELSSIADS